MNINSAFPSKYLKASDIPRPLKVVIKNVVMGDLGDGETKPVIEFNHDPRIAGHDSPAMVLNKTNANLISAAYGPETTAWLGQTVGLWVDPNVQFQGKTVPGLRIKVFQAEPKFESESVAPATIAAPQLQPASVVNPVQTAPLLTTTPGLANPVQTAPPTTAELMAGHVGVAEVTTAPVNPVQTDTAAPESPVDITLGDGEPGDPPDFNDDIPF